MTTLNPRVRSLILSSQLQFFAFPVSLSFDELLRFHLPEVAISAVGGTSSSKSRSRCLAGSGLEELRQRNGEIKRARMVVKQARTRPRRRRRVRLLEQLLLLLEPVSVLGFSHFLRKLPQLYTLFPLFFFFSTKLHSSPNFLDYTIPLLFFETYISVQLNVFHFQSSIKVCFWMFDATYFFTKYLQ